MKKKKIAVIGLKGLPAYGGAASVGESIINHLQNRYCFTVFSTSSHTLLETGEYKGIFQKVYKKLPFIKLNTFYYYVRCALHLLFNNYDVVHWHHSDAAFLIPIVRLRQKVILTTHGAFNAGLSPKWKKYHWFFKVQLGLVRYADIVTCVSQNEKRLFKEKYNINVDYIPNGIDITSYMELSKESYSDNYLFFAAGRLMESKGVTLLIKALDEINYKGKIKIAGAFTDKNYEKYIHKLSENLDIEFLGMIKEKSILLKYLYGCTLFVYPTYREAMSMMMLEAASVKAPILCSNIQENRDLFTQNEVSYFKTENIESLKMELINCLSTRKQMKEKAHNAFLKLENNYNWKAISTEYSKMYDSLISIP